MTDHTERNTKLLELNPHILALNTGEPVDRVEIVPTRVADTPTLRVRLEGRDIMLHSSFDPWNDARRWAEGQRITDTLKYAIVFGFGLGYHVEALLEAYPQIKRVYVIEVREDVFRAALSARDLSTLLMDTRIYFFAGPYPQIRDSFDSFFEKLTSITQDDQAEVLIHKPSLEAFPDDSAELREMLEYIRISSNTREVFKKEREENIAANHEVFDASPGVKELFGSYAGKPLIVAATGPSLDVSLEILKKYAGAAPDVVAVDSALAPFHRAGLRPKFVVTGDPQKKTDSLFKGLNIENEELIYFPSSNPDVVKRFENTVRRAACSEVSEDERNMDESAGKGLLFFSGTVLMAAVDFAFKTDADPIALIGADFAFSGNQTHASGSHIQGMLGRYGRTREVPNLCGDGLVQTSDVLYIYKRDFEKYYLRNIWNKRNLYNSTAFGAAIFHVPHIHLENFIYCYHKA